MDQRPQRRILVIGSQCRALGHLDFLPQAAEDLYKVMIDPERGECVPALEGGGLLIDPSVNQAKDAIKQAYRRAAKDAATLFIAYIGHGEKSSEDYYLLPQDAENPPDTDTALHLTNLIKEAHRKAPGSVDGLGVLVDACYAGVGGFAAAQAWIGGLEGTLRFEVLTAAADRPAANGCFSRNLTALLREGVSVVPSEHLLCHHLRPLIESSCPNQVPQHPAYNPDETLWLARNGGRILEPWAKTALADEIQRLTLAHQVTPALGEVVAHSRTQRCLAVVGNAGMGKSALAAALAWPKVAKGIVPAGFVKAIALLTEATTPQEIARTFTEQLARAIPGFREAQQAFAQETPYAEQQKLDTLQRQLVGPLKRLAPAADVRLVLDGLDRLATGAWGSIMVMLEELAELDFVRMVITARPDTVLPKTALAYPLAKAPQETVLKYLEQRGIPHERREEAANAAQGSWLVTRVLADLLCERPDAEIGVGQLALGDAYEELLQRCGAGGNNDTRHVLAILAAAGAGPLLPLPLLCVASAALGGPNTPAGIHDHLVRLRGLVVRSAAGTEQEHAGLFHQTLAEHIVAHAADENHSAHRALVASIQALSPVASGPADLNNSIQRYAFEREAEHFWILREIDKAFKSLEERTSPVPRDNLRRWRLWFSRMEATFGPNHLDTLRIRNNIAVWTGLCGNNRESLELLHALLPDQQRVLGPDHPETLTTRNNIAFGTGECGNNLKALRLFQALLPDDKRVRGPDHPATLRTRSHIAFWTGQCGNAREALELLQALLPDHKRVRGPDHLETLAIRGNIATWTSECGDAREALRLSQALLPDRERVLGPDHPNTLTTRSNIASCTGQCGEAWKALELLQALLPDQQRVLGPDHPNTLTTRSNIASWTGRCGNAREALELLQALLLDHKRVRGPDHPETLAIRGDIATWTSECGDAREALRLSQALLPDRERVLGPDHPDTLTTRGNIASWTSECGDAREALRLSQALLPDRERVLGPDHPDTLTTHGNIASWTSECGNAREALRLSQALLPDQQRVLGFDHPNTLTTRSNIAAFTGQCGEAWKALELLQALLPDQQRVLGPDHPNTLTTRNNIASWTGRCGNAREALQLCLALLPDQQRVLGPDHPDTLRTRNNIAAWTGQCGNAREALRLFQALLPDHKRVLGPDHPETLRTRSNIAGWINRCGNAREALELLQALLPDRERVLGPSHPDTLAIRGNIAGLTSQCGNAREALQLCLALLPDQQRVLGPDHANTLTTQKWIDYFSRG